jgi:hypothetical protein
MGRKDHTASAIATASILLGAGLPASAQNLLLQPQQLHSRYVYFMPVPAVNVRTTYSAVVEDETLPVATFAEIPAGTRLPVTLESRVRFDELKDATVVRAHINKPVVLKSGQTIPTGTLVVGHIIKMANSEWLGPEAVKVVFDQIQLTNGTMVPIAAKAPNEMIFAPTTSHAYEPGETLELEITAPAQVSNIGAVL